MSTTHERTLEREMEVLGFAVQAARPLRTKDFDPLIDEFRARGDMDLFPLGRTTLKSALSLATKEKLFKRERLLVGGRYYMFYQPTKRGIKAWHTWNGTHYA